MKLEGNKYYTIYILTRLHDARAKERFSKGNKIYYETRTLLYISTAGQSIHDIPGMLAGYNNIYLFFRHVMTLALPVLMIYRQIAI